MPHITAEETVTKLSQLLTPQSWDHQNLLSSFTYSSVGFDWIIIVPTVSSQLWVTHSQVPLSHMPAICFCESIISGCSSMDAWLPRWGNEVTSCRLWASWSCSGKTPQSWAQRQKCTSSCARGPNIKVSDSLISGLQLAAFPCCLHVLLFSVPLLSPFISQFPSHTMG